MARLAASGSAFEAVNTLNVTCLMARLAASHSAFEVMNTTFDITFIYLFLNLRLRKVIRILFILEFFFACGWNYIYETVWAQSCEICCRCAREFTIQSDNVKTGFGDRQASNTTRNVKN